MPKITEIIGGHIGNAISKLRDAVRKHRPTVTYRGSVEVEIAQLRYPRQFFTDCKDLSLSGNFQAFIAATKEVAVGTKFLLDHYEITKQGGATDVEIEKAFEVKGNHLFEIVNLAAIIVELISAQEGGKEGILLSNGKANIFYAPSLVMSVYWDVVAGEWDVRPWRRVGRRWSQDRRVFVPGN